MIQGCLGRLREDPFINKNNALLQALDGVMKGAVRLRQIVNSLLDVARLDIPILVPRVEPVSLGLTLRLIQKDYGEDLALRRLPLAK